MISTYYIRHLLGLIDMDLFKKSVPTEKEGRFLWEDFSLYPKRLTNEIYNDIYQKGFDNYQYTTDSAEVVEARLRFALFRNGYLSSAVILSNMSTLLLICIVDYVRRNNGSIEGINEEMHSMRVFALYSSLRIYFEDVDSDEMLYLLTASILDADNFAEEVYRAFDESEQGLYDLYYGDVEAKINQRESSNRDETVASHFANKNIYENLIKISITDDAKLISDTRFPEELRVKSIDFITESYRLWRENRDAWMGHFIDIVHNRMEQTYNISDKRILKILSDEMDTPDDYFINRGTIDHSLINLLRGSNVKNIRVEDIKVFHSFGNTLLQKGTGILPLQLSYVENYETLKELSIALFNEVFYERIFDNPFSTLNLEKGINETALLRNEVSKIFERFNVKTACLNEDDIPKDRFDETMLDSIKTEGEAVRSPHMVEMFYQKKMGKPKPSDIKKVTARIIDNAIG